VTDKEHSEDGKWYHGEIYMENTVTKCTVFTTKNFEGWMKKGTVNLTVITILQ
jgi:hypothetical protein